MAKKARKSKEPPTTVKELPEKGEPSKQDEEETEQTEENKEPINEELKQYLAKSKAELREICRAKGIKGFANLKQTELAKLALEGANNPEQSNLRNDQLRLRLRELGMKGVSGSRADLLAKVIEAEFLISKRKDGLSR